MDLGAELKARRKTAGRTIASVAVDAGLSVPYIANLENGRGNPTLATLTRLAEALGTTLRVDLEDSEKSSVATSRTSDLSPRAVQVIKQLAEAQQRSPQAVRQDLQTALGALAGLLDKDPTPADLDRLLDLSLLGTEKPGTP